MTFQNRTERTFREKFRFTAGPGLRNRMWTRVQDELVQTHRLSVSPPVGWWATLQRYPLRIAAIVVIAVALLVVHRPSSGPESARTKITIVSNLELATAASLEKAFRQGGLEAVERQYRKVFTITPRDGKTHSVEELLSRMETDTQELKGENL